MSIFLLRMYRRHPSTMRARRIGDYVMTEAKQARMREIAQQERDRECATLLAQQQSHLEKSASASSRVRTEHGPQQMHDLWGEVGPVLVAFFAHGK